MVHSVKVEYVEAIRVWYGRVGKRAMGLLLDVFVQVCGYGRKHALSLRSRPHQ